MARSIAYKIEISPVDTGAVSSMDTIKKGVAKSEGTQHTIIVVPSSAQIQGVMGYLGLIKAGDDTSTVETAITALTP